MSEDAFDLDAYRERIGLVAGGAPSHALLTEVVARHTATIPFENIDVFLGRPIRFDLPTVSRKLVGRARGGYCFEQNALLQYALTALGFTATPLLARVIRGAPADAMAPSTHMVLLVDIPEGRFLADVGFGNLSPTAPLSFALRGPQPTRHEPFEVAPVGEEFVVAAHVGATWQNLYRVNMSPAVAPDLEVANWFTATNPAAPFLHNVIAALPGEGFRRTLFNARLARRDMANVVGTTRLGSPDDYDTVLRREFGIALAPEELSSLRTRLATRPADAPGEQFFSS